MRSALLREPQSSPAKNTASGGACKDQSRSRKRWKGIAIGASGKRAQRRATGMNGKLRSERPAGSTCRHARGQHGRSSAGDVIVVALTCTRKRSTTTEQYSAHPAGDAIDEADAMTAPEAGGDVRAIA